MDMLRLVYAYVHGMIDLYLLLEPSADVSVGGVGVSCNLCCPAVEGRTDWTKERRNLHSNMVEEVGLRSGRRPGRKTQGGLSSDRSQKKCCGIENTSK